MELGGESAFYMHSFTHILLCIMLPRSWILSLFPSFHSLPSCFSLLLPLFLAYLCLASLRHIPGWYFIACHSHLHTSRNTLRFYRILCVAKQSLLTHDMHLWLCSLWDPSPLLPTIPALYNVLNSMTPMHSCNSRWASTIADMAKLRKAGSVRQEHCG